MATIETDAVALGAGPLLIQNLGADDLYVGDTEDVDGDSGIVITAGYAVAVGGREAYFVVSEGSSDARILTGGLGYFTSPAPA